MNALSVIADVTLTVYVLRLSLCKDRTSIKVLLSPVVNMRPLVPLQIQKASCSSAAGGDEGGRKGTISQYFTTLHCPVCDELTQLGVCSRCRAEPQRVAVTLYQDMRQWESQQDQLLKVRGSLLAWFSGLSSSSDILQPLS